MKDIKIYKTTECGACKTLINMIGDKLNYEIINLTLRPDLTPSDLNGVPQVYVDGNKLSNPFAVMELI